VAAETKFWIQIAGAAFFGLLVIAEIGGLKAPTFGFEPGWVIFLLAGLVMLFEAWRTRRKAKSEQKDE